MSLPTVLDLARLIVSRALTGGAAAVDAAIDATVGNGHDTLFLAQQTGRVFGFDVQASALAATRERLREAAVLDRVELFHAGHEHLKEHVPRSVHGRIGAVMFNLGFLPGSTDRSLVTRPETTLPALAAALDVLAPGGVLTVVLYPAHPGGREEAVHVERWASRLPRDAFDVYTYRPFNARRDAPRLLAVSRRVPPVPVVPRERPDMA